MLMLMILDHTLRTTDLNMKNVRFAFFFFNLRGRERACSSGGGAEGEEAKSKVLCCEFNPMWKLYVPTL